MVGFQLEFLSERQKLNVHFIFLRAKILLFFRLIYFKESCNDHSVACGVSLVLKKEEPIERGI